MRIQFTTQALEYFNELSTILYQKEYFGFQDNALKYVDDLIDDIVETLPNRQKKVAPEVFKKYGDKLLYATFKKNKNTQWYVFFNIYQDHNQEFIYVIRYINNNHLLAQNL